ncbi:MAG: tail fiber domain-containing protein [Nanoarchaeota archaeon]
MKKRLSKFSIKSKEKYYSLSKFEKLMFLSAAIFILIFFGAVLVSGILNAYPYVPAGGSVVTSDSIWQIVNNVVELVDSSKDFTINNSDFYVNVTSGNVGIGTSSPTGNLDILGDETFGSIILRRNDASTDNLLGIVSSGNSVDGGLASIRFNEDGANDSAKIEFWTEATGSSQSEKMVIDSSGNVGIGTSNPAKTLSVAGNISVGSGNIEVTSSSDGQLQLGGTGYSAFIAVGATGMAIGHNSAIREINFYLNEIERAKISTTGDFYTNDGTVSSLSDKRVKKDISPLADGLNKLLELKPVTFRYNGNASLATDDGTIRYGFIADEVMEVLPNYVTVNKGILDGKEIDDLKSLSTIRMIPMIVNAIKELTIKEDLRYEEISAENEMIKQVLCEELGKMC